MKYGRSLQELAIELDRQAKVKKDYVATAGAMQMTAVNENFDLVIGNTPFQLNENAHRQLGLQLKIPAPYYERMRAENPGLLMANVNGWFQQSPDTRRMVRTLDGTARAILSDRYRRIDNYEVAQTVLPIISEMQGARIESCELTDGCASRWWMQGCRSRRLMFWSRGTCTDTASVMSGPIWSSTMFRTAGGKSGSSQESCFTAQT